jgi:hypothetical protein
MFHAIISDKFLKLGDKWLTVALIALAAALIYIALTQSTMVKAITAAWVVLP